MSEYSINLLPKREKKIVDKLLYFVLHYFRYIIVITQIVVISVFFYRFREDQKIIDLKESFKQKQQILSITVPLVQEAEAIKRSTGQIEVILNEQDIYIKKLDYVLNAIPNDTVLRNISVEKSRIQLVGTSTHLTSIRALNKKLTQFEEYSSSKITTVDKAPDGTYKFVIDIKVSA